MAIVRMAFLCVLALAPASLGTLLEDINNTVWDTDFTEVRFAINSNLCANADGTFRFNRGLLHDVELAAPNTITGRWSEGLASDTANCDPLPTGRTSHGRFLFVFDDSRTSWMGMWGVCEGDTLGVWNGTRAERPVNPLLASDCPDIPDPNEPTPTPTPNLPPGADHAPLRFDLAGDRVGNSSEAYVLIERVDVGTVPAFYGGRVLPSADADGVFYALLQILILLLLGEIVSMLARSARRSSLALSSWNRLTGLDWVFHPVQAFLNPLFALCIRQEYDRADETVKITRNTLIGIGLGFLLLSGDIGLLIGSQSFTQVVTKEEVFSPVLVFNNNSKSRLVNVGETCRRIQVIPESGAIDVDRHLQFFQSVSLSTSGSDSRQPRLIVRGAHQGYIETVVWQGNYQLNTLTAVEWESQAKEGRIRLPLSFVDDNLTTLTQWLRRMDRDVNFITDEISVDASTGDLIATSQTMFTNVTNTARLVTQHLIGSLTITNTAYDDVERGSVELTPPFEEPWRSPLDFSVGRGTRPRIPTTILSGAAGVLLLATIILNVSMWGRFGDNAEVLVRRHFALLPETRLWRVSRERDLRTRFDDSSKDGTGIERPDGGEVDPF